MIHTLTSLERGRVTFNIPPTFFLNSSFLNISRIISSDSQGSNFSSNIVLLNGLSRILGAGLMTGVRVTRLLDGLERVVTAMTLLTGLAS